MNQQEPLRGTLLGGFYLENSRYGFPKDLKKNLQVGKLIAYLLLNRKRPLPKSQIMEVLWPEGNAENPDGALRNLVYRARRELQNFFPEGRTEFILLKENTYSWNPEAPLLLDVELFESACAMSRREQNPERRYRLCREALNLYKGELLPPFAESEWVSFQGVYYRRLYTETAVNGCECLEKLGQFEEVIGLCEELHHADYLDGHIHESKLNAYLKLGRTTEAIDYYNSVVDLYYGKMGLDLPERVKQIYHELLAQMPHYRLSMNELEQNLEEDGGQGSFYCNYDVFKNVYQINARAARRALRTRFLVLLTLEDGTGGAKGEVVEAETELLREVIRAELRRNDVFSQFSLSQYSVILAAQNEENCKKAVNRILERYGQKKQHPQVTLLAEIRVIS